MADENPVEPVFQSVVMSGVVPQRGQTLIEEKIQYCFSDPTLLTRALTHGSTGRKAADYQRLEFLGDRVLSLCIAEALYREHRDESEGQMATRLSSLVKGETCAIVGENIGIQDFIIVGTSEREKGLHNMRSVIGDVVEALIGAIYLDGGLEPARRFINLGWDPLLNQPSVTVKDAKTFVQEWALGRALSLPRYEIVSRTGPEHKPEFTVRILVGGKVACEGVGHSKQSAEMNAAEKFIAQESLRT